jgi:Ca-activated chloride channel homolog
VAFGTDVKSFRPSVTARNAAIIKEAGAFLDDLVPAGRTNIGDALARALAGEAEKGRMRIMLFLTDGAPTAGELEPDKIIGKLAAANRGGMRVHVCGVGDDVDARLLGRIAEETQGSAEFIRTDEEIDVKVAGLYNRLSNPVLSDVHIDFGGLAVNGLYPKQVTTLFKGQDLVLFGRYRKGGKHTVTVSGTFVDEARSYRYDVDFPDKEEIRNGYVATLWATRRIGHLMQEMRLHGQNKELVDEIVRLGRQFGIITEYTMFLADSGGRPAPDAPAVAGAAMLAAHREIGGKWAVAQARNEQRMQQVMVAQAEQLNVYEDRAGEERKESRIAQVGRRTFYRQGDGGWVEGTTRTNAVPDGVPAKARAVKFLSEEYLRLVRQNREFSEAQRLGANVEMEVNGERIRVSE